MKNIWLLLLFFISYSLIPAPFAYFTNQLSNNVTPIDIATNTTEPTVAVGSLPLGIAITPNNQTAYVTNSGSNSVSAIDITTNTLAAFIPVGDTPSDVAITPDGTTA